ncbi:MAG: formylglycine-generating enzyme family protein [Chitinispirillales bacterium]|nr:formylglycine-generating enzyme family protein [Chitinispirillales bacterium]
MNLKPSIIIAFSFSYTLFAISESVSISGGSFNMGSEHGSSDETPIHSVTLSDYKIDKRQVSNKDYNECVTAGKCSKPHYKDGLCFLWTNQGLSKINPHEELLAEDNPVVCVSWKQAVEYCKFRSGRLPTEAEWEYAATNGGKTIYSWGNEKPTHSNARFRSRNSTSVYTNSPTGEYKLTDMNGNVWEWINDKYEQNYYTYSPQKDPKGATVGRFNVIRGGGWYSDENSLRSTNRHWFSPEAAEISIGIRCAK